MRLSPKWLPPILVLLGLRYAAAADDLPGYLPPDTKVVLGVQVRTIVDSLSQTLGAELRGQITAALAQTPLAGFDPLKDLDEILIASTGKGNNPPTLVVLRGRFDVPRLAAKAKPYQGVPVIDSGQPSQGVLALLDGATAIAGEPPMVRAAIDRQRKGAHPKFAWAGRTDSLRQKYAVWGVGDIPEKPKAAAGQAGPLDSLDRFEFGAAFSNGLELTADLHPRSPADLEKMAQTLRMLVAMIEAKAPASKGSQFALSAGNGTLRLSVRIPQADLNQAMEAQRAGRHQQDLRPTQEGIPSDRTEPGL